MGCNHGNLATCGLHMLPLFLTGQFMFFFTCLVVACFFFFLLFCVKNPSAL